MSDSIHISHWMFLKCAQVGENENQIKEKYPG